LVECSLVQAEESGPGMRYRMLETLREYGKEQLRLQRGGRGGEGPNQCRADGELRR